jgi:hypothetical protein
VAAARSEDLVIAALLWNTPVLRRATDPGAQAFVDAFGARPFSDLPAGDDALTIAARAVRAEQEGNSESAAANAALLMGSEDARVAALGVCLHWWSSAPLTPEITNRTEKVLGRLRSTDLRARISLKLAVNAYDRDLADEFKHYFVEARRLARSGSSLGRAIAITSANLLQTDLTEADFKPPARSDPLVDYNWIDDLALAAARHDLQQLAEDRARSPWGWSFRSGRTPLDELVAAEQQATWAGALWKRPTLRRQLGAQMLVGGPRTPQHVLFGLTMWILGGGRQIPQMVDLVEPSFDHETADALVRSLTSAVTLPAVRDLALAEAAAATWDLLSDRAVADLLKRLSVDVSPLGQPSRTVWAQAALRIPNAWQSEVLRLAPAQQAALVGSLSRRALVDLPRGVAETLLRAYEETERVSDVDDEAGAVILRWTLSPTNVPSDVSAGVAVEVATRLPAALSEVTYAAAERKLAAAFKKEVEEARKGTGAFGTRSTASALSAVVTARSEVNEETVRVLVDAVMDGSVPANLRVGGLAALARLANANLLSEETLHQIRSAPEAGTPSFLYSVPPELLRASKLFALATILSSNEEIQLLVLSRERDPRVRHIIASAAAIAQGRAPSASAEAAILAALFDPDEGVVEVALGAVRTVEFSVPGITDAIVRRLRSLFVDYGREVRAETVRAARARIEKGLDEPELTWLLSAAIEDRSWLVRDAVREFSD